MSSNAFAPTLGFSTEEDFEIVTFREPPRSRGFWDTVFWALTPDPSQDLTWTAAEEELYNIEHEAEAYNDALNAIPNRLDDNFNPIADVPPRS